MPDNRPSVYPEGDNTIVYRASALGHCLRHLWAARSDLEARPFPDTIRAAMDEGTRLEPTILQSLAEDHNFDLAGVSQLQVEIKVGAWNGKTLIVRGKLDEVGGPFGHPMYPIDVKAFSQSLVFDYRAHGITGLPRYAWQQSVYAEGYGSHCGYMPIYNKDIEKIEPWSLDLIPQTYSRDQIRDRVLSVEEYYANNQIPPCTNEYPCPYYYLHDDTKPSTEFFPDNLSALIRARITLSQRVTTFDNARKTLDRAISARLTQDTRYAYNGYEVRVLPNPARFNTTAAKALLTEAEVPWETDPTYWIPGRGTYLRVTPKTKKVE